jgi:hypothetical protein
MRTIITDLPASGKSTLAEGISGITGYRNKARTYMILRLISLFSTGTGGD